MARLSTCHAFLPGLSFCDNFFYRLSKSLSDESLIDEVYTQKYIIFLMLAYKKFAKK